MHPLSRNLGFAPAAAENVGERFVVYRIQTCLH